MPISFSKLHEKYNRLLNDYLIAKAERDELRKRVKFLEDKIERIKSECRK